ncbi:Tm-1-like ATP-binding domain-containing protein [bacterium]|nr:Tm-1-like ATP-binding domain-containing protein [bacterium]
MKTIAIISSCDTKHQEAAFMKEQLIKDGVNAIIVDMSIGLGEPKNADITREEVFANAGLDWNAVKGKTKGQLMELMMDAMSAMILKLYRERRIDGVVAAGGVQNTTVAMTAMQALPIGFPKVIASTVACGQKPFGLVVGTSDITVMPSISDFTGLNMMTRAILSNACACVAGMARFSGSELKKPDRPVVGVSLMGITNEGCCAAIDELDRLGIESVGFHTTGVGGTIMEKLALDGLLDGILDMTTHEITSEYFGGGFSYDAKDRLTKTVDAQIPMVVSVGGLDFVDFDKAHFPPRMDERVYNMHNATLAHIKILPDEAVEIGSIFAERLNRTPCPLKLVFPTEGMRKNTRKGENMYSRETDEALLGTIRSRCGEKIEILEIEGNLNDRDWGRRIAHVMADALKQRGIQF